MIFKKQRMKLRKSIRNSNLPKRMVRRARTRLKRIEKEKLGMHLFQKLKLRRNQRQQLLVKNLMIKKKINLRQPKLLIQCQSKNQDLQLQHLCLPKQNLSKLRSQHLPVIKLHQLRHQPRKMRNQPLQKKLLHQHKQNLLKPLLLLLAPQSKTQRLNQVQNLNQLPHPNQIKSLRKTSSSNLNQQASQSKHHQRSLRNQNKQHQLLQLQQRPQQHQHLSQHLYNLQQQVQLVQQQPSNQPQLPNPSQLLPQPLLPPKFNQWQLQHHLPPSRLSQKHRLHRKQSQMWIQLNWRMIILWRSRMHRL